MTSQCLCVCMPVRVQSGGCVCVLCAQACWAQNPNDRPTFTEVERQLRAWKPIVVNSHQVSGGDSLDALM